MSYYKPEKERSCDRFHTVCTDRLQLKCVQGCSSLPPVRLAAVPWFGVGTAGFV